MEERVGGGVEMVAEFIRARRRERKVFRNKKKKANSEGEKRGEERREEYGE